MAPKSVTIRSKRQGSLNPNSPNSKARFQWCLQLGCRFGLYTLTNVREILKEYNNYDDNKALPRKFNPMHLTLLHMDQIVTWDEVHRKVTPRSDAPSSHVTTSSKRHALKFKQDKTGKLDNNRTYSDECIYQTKCKYMDEAHFSFGVAVVTPILDCVPQKKEGRRCHPFVYMGKTLLSIPDYKKKINEEIQRVRNLKNGSTSGWVIQDLESVGRIYENDLISCIKGVGKNRGKSC